MSDPEIKAEAAEIVRSQIERITLTPGEDGGLQVELYGDLARILQLCESGSDKDRRAPERMFRGVVHAEDYRWLRGQDLNLRPSGYEPCRSPFAGLRKIAQDYAKSLI